MAPSAVILPGASTNPDFDIAQLQGLQDVDENAFSGRVDFRLNNNWSAYVRVFHDQGNERSARRRHRPRRAHHRQPDQRRLQPAGH